MIFIHSMSYHDFQRVVYPRRKAKWLKTCLSFPAESKIAENTLEPADEGS